MTVRECGRTVTFRECGRTVTMRRNGEYLSPGKPGGYRDEQAGAGPDLQYHKRS